MLVCTRRGALAALAALPLGCRETTTFGDRLAPRERITVLFPQVIEGPLDPRLNIRAWPGKLLHLMFEGAVSVHNAALEPRPALAERIEQPAPEVYELTVRADARFHDGAAVTAEDLRATYASVLEPSLGSPFRSLFERVVRMEVLDPRRLRIVINGPHAPFLSDLSLGVLPARSIGPGGRLVGPPIGAGPYQLAARSDDVEVVLERHAPYWRGQPRTPYLVLRTVRDENTRLLALLSGAADLVQNAVTPRLVDAMRDRPELTISRGPGVAYSYLAFNLRDPALADVRVRRAIAHAIDRQRLIDHKFCGTASPSTGMLAPGHWAYSDKVDHYPYDPAAATALLDAVGLPPATADTPRLRLSFKTSTDKFRRNLVRLMAADLRVVGIEANVEGFELGTLLADAKSGNFQLFTLQWPGPSEPHFYNWIFHSERIPTPEAPDRGGNRGGYVNPEMDRLIDAGRVEIDPKARAAIYAQVQAIAAADLPYLSLWHEDVVAVHRRGLMGYAPLPNASLFNLWQAGWR
ncbi:MAG: ABC transporter substrate-binding protein [Myxococcales bacterium]|nr:ABC transporter substrate-binding protein [Myxococcales bacterium]